MATVAYRAEKVLRDPPPGFGAFRVSDGVRTPGEILAHLGDLMDWAVGMTRGEYVWRDAPVLPWGDGVARFFDALGLFDAQIAAGEAGKYSDEMLMQGPIADSLTHIGQLALLRRVAGGPVRGESYAQAEIVIGRVGASQSARRVEFD